MRFFTMVNGLQFVITPQKEKRYYARKIRRGRSNNVERAKRQKGRRKNEKDDGNQNCWPKKDEERTT